MPLSLLAILHAAMDLLSSSHHPVHCSQVGEVLASERVKSFNASLAAWFESAKVVADAAIDKVKSPKLIEGVAAAREALSAAFLKAREASDPDVAFKLASDAWISFVE